LTVASRLISSERIAVASAIESANVKSKDAIPLGLPYKVDRELWTVNLLAIGVKIKERLYIGGKEFEL
jgi:hypothetical protein